MKENYKAFIDRLIQRYEGGYCWDSGDRGGPTKYGITCYDLAEHRHQHMDSMNRWAPIVRAMSLDEAEQIYASKYATKCRFDDLVSGSDCVILDYGVNSGTVRPIHVAQRLFGRPVNNIFDDILLGRINMANPSWFINKMCDERMRFLQALRIWPHFHTGWTARVVDLRQYCLHLAATKPASSVMPAKEAAPVPPAPPPTKPDEAVSLAPAGKAIVHPEQMSWESAIMHPIHFLEEELKHRDRDEHK